MLPLHFYRHKALLKHIVIASCQVLIFLWWISQHMTALQLTEPRNPRPFGYEFYALTNCAITARLYTLTCPEAVPRSQQRATVTVTHSSRHISRSTFWQSGTPQSRNVMLLFCCFFWMTFLIRSLVKREYLKCSCLISYSRLNATPLIQNMITCCHSMCVCVCVCVCVTLRQYSKMHQNNSSNKNNNI